MKLLLFLFLLLPVFVFLVNLFISRFSEQLKHKYKKFELRKKLQEKSWETDMELLNLEVQKGLLKKEIEQRQHTIGKYAEVNELKHELKEVNKLIKSIREEENI